jgi:hypothetical protein
MPAALRRNASVSLANVEPRDGQPPDRSQPWVRIESEKRFTKGQDLQRQDNKRCTRDDLLFVRGRI